jgi:hypothetical protein
MVVRFRRLNIHPATPWLRYDRRDPVSFTKHAALEVSAQCLPNSRKRAVDAPDSWVLWRANEDEV